MQLDVRSFFSRLTESRWARFFLLAAAMMALLYAAARFFPLMPPVAVAVVWVLLALVVFFAHAYHLLMGKLVNQYALNGEGLLSRLNNGRVVTLLFSFVLALATAAGLLLETSTWLLAGEWLLAPLAIVVFAVAVFLPAPRMQRELGEPFNTASTSSAACWATAFFLCAVYALIQGLLPHKTYESLALAFSSAQDPLAGSPSALLADAGVFLSYVRALSDYFAFRVGELSGLAGGFVRIALAASTFYVMGRLLEVCYLGPSEIKRIFLPLDGAQLSSKSRRASGGEASLQRYAVVPVLLTAVIVVGFPFVDAAYGEVRASEEYTRAQEVVREVVDLAVYIDDGIPYEKAAVDELYASLEPQAEELLAERQGIEDAINQMYDQMVVNVDDYLDWYYSLGADYGRLVATFVGDIDEVVSDQLSTTLLEGVDQSVLDSLDEYAAGVNDLREQWTQGLADCQVEGVPGWLFVDEGEPTVAGGAVSDVLGLESGTFVPRTVVSAAAGVASGVAGGVAVKGVAEKVVKKAVQKIVSKPFFTKAVERIAAMLGRRAVISGVTTVAGGVAGSPAFGAGAVAGAAVGAAVGTGVSVGVDYASLKIDEALNRESEKAEIVESIEESRAETLAALDQMSGLFEEE